MRGVGRRPGGASEPCRGGGVAGAVLRRVREKRAASARHHARGGPRRARGGGAHPVRAVPELQAGIGHRNHRRSRLRKTQRFHGGGAIAALVSNFFFGQGPWTPWQMYGWGLIGYLGGVLAQLGVFDGVRQVFGRVQVEPGAPDACRVRIRAARSRRPS